jgi:tripartite motif-containing protein 2/3/tripartite motif-containing protein 71
VEEADREVTIDCASQLEKLCQQNAKMAVAPVNVAVENTDASVNETSKIEIALTFQNGRPALKMQNIKVILASKVDGSRVPTKIARKQWNTYQIEFTPTVRGRYQLKVMYDKPVLREPVEIFVKIPPTMLGQPVRSFQVQGKAKFVSLSLSGEILITADKEIVVLDRRGKKLYSISNEKLEHPQGVAVSESGIFVADQGSHSLLKFDKTGKLLKSVGQMGRGKGQFNSPYGLTVVGDEVIMCDGGNHRLQVFTSDLEFVRQFGSYGTGNGRFMAPVDVAHDKDGKNLYVSDYTRDCVQVFTMQGQYLRYLVAKGDITNPTGIASDGELVYIIQLNGLLHIYRKNGDKVCSFPTKSGSAVRGVAVDQDGFIYVCDYNSSQVIVF